MSHSIKLEFLKNAIITVSDTQKLGVKSPWHKDAGKYYISGINTDSKFTEIYVYFTWLIYIRFSTVNFRNTISGPLNYVLKKLASPEFEKIFQVKSENFVLKTGKANLWCHPTVLDFFCTFPEKYFSNQMELVDVKGNNNNLYNFYIFSIIYYNFRKFRISRISL